MKKIIFTTCFIISSPILFAQIYLGGSAGLSLAKFNIAHEKSLSKESSTKYLAGLNIEVPILLKINKNVALQSGIGYYNMGSNVYPANASYNVINKQDPIYQALLNTNYNYILHYLSIPLTFNVSIPINKFSLYARAGIYASYLIQGSIKETSTQNKTTYAIKKGDMKQSDFGTLIGIGATREIGKGYVFLDAKFMIGLNNIYNSSTSNIYYMYANNQKINNRGLCMNVGYMFRISKEKEKLK
jgi:hypothetical protein